MPIEEIKIGDKVYTTDIETGEIVLREVKQVFETVAEIVVYIEVNGEQIKATEYHPFYTKNAGWKDAKELEIGDLLVLQTGEVAPIQGIRIEYLEEPIKVYNLEIDEYHVYFVGSSRVLVHNECGGSGDSSFRDSMSPEEATRYGAYWKQDAPEFNTPNLKITHIKERKGALEISIVIYDEFGRQKWRVDYNNHGFSDHSTPHLHEYIFGSGFCPIKGKETRYDWWR